MNQASTVSAGSDREVRRQTVSGENAGFRVYRRVDANTYEYDQFNPAGEKLTTVRATMSPDGGAEDTMIFGCRLLILQREGLSP